MGGDRDGNPFVTPSTTYQVSMMSRWTAATLFKADIARLRAELSLGAVSSEFLAAYPCKSAEPYREVLRGLNDRLDSTIAWTEEALGGHPSRHTATPLKDTAQLLEPLLAIHKSLTEVGLGEIADGSLTDTIRRAQAFGLALLPLDVRQESTRHSEALDAITRYLGVGSYLSWDESSRRVWLQQELASKRPLIPRNVPLSSLGFSDTVQDTLGISSLVASLAPGSLGAYVISQCQQVSDILAVALLQQDAGAGSGALRVVPLFETLDDLERSARVVDELLSVDVYRKRINGHQEVMVGYSDSAKDAGRFAASWAQYRAQEAIAQVANKHNISVTFFHGKGGTVGRGGNPALFRAILAHPPGTINGRFRVTEQGEMITQNFGRVSIAERTLDLFTAGVLAERYEPRPDPGPAWRAAMERLASVSCDVYRGLVRGDPRFVPYFKTATPEQELGGLNVGSRPSKRNPTGGVESLRAIPWNFSWTQTRMNL
jgi:phosphoenolpyruvate carboxylase